MRSLCLTTAVWLIAALAATTGSTLGATVRMVEFATPHNSWFYGGDYELISVGPNLTLAVFRDGDLAQAATVEVEFLPSPPGTVLYKQLDNTELVAAVAGRDFLASTRRVEFPPGEEMRVLSVPILDNGRRDETFLFFQARLVSHTDGLSVATPMVTIVTGENELPTTFDVTRPTGYEEANPLVLLSQSGVPVACLFQPLEDGKTLVWGEFDAVNGVPRPGLARLDSNGDLDSFVPAGPGDPNWWGGNWFPEFALSDGRKLKVISGGRFDGEAYHLQIFHADGAPDSTWPGVGLSGVNALRKPVGRFDEIQGRLRYTGSLASIDGIGVGWDGHFVEPVFYFHLTNAPKTSLRLSVGGVGTNSSVAVFFRRLGSTEAPATVHFATRSITGTAAQHYLPQSGTVSFAPRELGKVVTIPLSPDGPPEFHEIFEVAVTDGEGFEALPAPYRWTMRGTGEAFAPRLDRVHRLRDGRVLLGGVGASGTGIEFSHDLKAWQPLTNLMGGFYDASDVGVWLDTSATNGSVRFYRAVVK